MNTWANPNTVNVSSLSQLEDTVLEHITKAKTQLPPLHPSILEKSKDDIDKLVINVFKEKIEKKYNDQLNDEQKKIVGFYVFSQNEIEAKNNLIEMLQNIKTKTMNNIENELKEAKKGPTKNKLSEVKECLNSDDYNPENITENTVAFYMAVCALNTELETTK
jgi:hypothetical protein